jgi:hypothetical protein
LSFIVVSPLSFFLHLIALILTTPSADGTASRDAIADHSSSAGVSVPVSGVVTSTTLEGDESPEAFHA